MASLRLNLAVLLLASLIIASSAIVLVGRPPVEVELRVVDAYDSAKIGRLDTLVVEVRNLGGSELSPVFFVTDGSPGGYKAWKIVEGPRLVEPGAKARFVIKSPYPLNAIPPSRGFIVLLLDPSNETVKAKSRLCRFNLPFTPLRNPNLDYWVYDVKKGYSEPFAWSFIYCKEGVEHAYLEKVDDTARLVVANLSRRKGDWLMSGLWQTVEFPEVVEVKVKPMFSTPVSRRPSRVVAVEVGYGHWDWDEHRRISNYTVIPYKGLWIAFTNDTEEPILLRNCMWEGVAIYFVPVKVGEWNVVKVNVTRLLLELGWELPEPQPYTYEGNLYVIRRAELTLFVAKYPWTLHPKEPLEAYFDYVKITPHRG
ncbi:MAG: hypothetical protein DRJ97_01795 [Thermoprotei archaeon]|nr:MAG: hypothetical protein DRJ97_01795 [Thermoprotei archaeon]